MSGYYVHYTSVCDVSVLWREEWYTVTYILSPRKIQSVDQQILNLFLLNMCI